MSLYKKEDHLFLSNCIKYCHNGYKHLNHWNTDRNKFFNKLPKNAVCAEVGVLAGKNAYRINSICNPSKLYLIDPWDRVFIESDGGGIEIKNLEMRVKAKNDEENNIRNNFANNRNNIEVIKDFSVSASKNFKDNFLDWVYIDADHRYEYVILDLNHWYPKVKKNGYIAGHDYDNKGGDIQRAVEDFLKSHSDCDLVYKPPPHLWGKDSSDGHYDFLIKKS